MISSHGLPHASATVVVGSSGTGKTTFGLHFAARASAAEPTLFFTFFESKSFLRKKAASFGIDLAALEADGSLVIVCNAQAERSLDELAHSLLDEVARRKVRRLVIDGLVGFFEATTYPQRMGRFFSCLCNELRRRGVTMVMTLETRDAVTTVVPTPYGVSAMVDNLVFLRFVEHDGRIKRLLSLIKVRDAHFDASLREVEISDHGMSIAGRFSAGGDVIPTAEPVGREAPAGSHSSSDGKA
jgi:circadian clock protein KaiC